MKSYTFKYTLDDPKRSLEHREILLKKSCLKKIYESWYKTFKSYTKENSTYVELGSGGGFIKEIIPEIITSDLNEIPGLDLHFSADNMPFTDNSVSGIFMIDALHHFSNVDRFFNEAARVLEKGGKIIAVEPWNTFWSRFIYKKFHHELFDLNRDWLFPTTGPLSGSNMALPYIIFKRDIDVFNKEHPKLRVNRLKPNTPFSYLLTGGFSRSPFLPCFFIRWVHFLENQISFIRNKLAMFVTIEIEKVED